LNIHIHCDELEGFLFYLIQSGSAI